MTELGRPAKIAIGFAVVALLTSLVAVVVVMKRSNPAPVAAKVRTSLDRTVDAAEVAKLKRDVVEKATDDRGSAVGVKVTDAGLRGALGLEAGDILTAVGGREIKREFDVYDAVLGVSMMNASIVYVEIVRGGQPLLVRWKLEGDLRAARRDANPRPRTNIFGSPSTAPDPFAASGDPLLDTIQKLDDFEYEVPKSTVDRLFAEADRYMRGARIVPAMRNGQPEGFKLYAVRPSSVFSAIGLQNGDTIRAINGAPLTSLDRALEVVVEMQSARVIELEIVRRGAGKTLKITVK